MAKYTVQSDPKQEMQRYTAWYLLSPFPFAHVLHSPVSSSNHLKVYHGPTQLRSRLHPSKIPLSFKLLNKSGSKNLLIVTSSARPFLLLVFKTKSRAVAWADAGSSGRS